jgi:hypothetical protein
MIAFAATMVSTSLVRFFSFISLHSLFPSQARYIVSPDAEFTAQDRVSNIDYAKGH